MASNFNESGAFYYTDPSLPSPDVQLHFAYAIVDDHGRYKHPYGGYTCHVCLLRPKSRGRLELVDGQAETPPLIDPAFLADEDESGGHGEGSAQGATAYGCPSIR